MNPELRELIEELRADLDATDPVPYAWGQIGVGAAPDAIPADVPQQYRELLEVADGILAGGFELHSAAGYDYFQSVLTDMPEFTHVSDAPEAWFAFGTLDGEPLLLHRDTGAVWYFPPTSGDEWYMREEFEGVATDLDSFLAYYVFGAGYGEVAFEEEPDEWWEFLERHDLTIPGEDDEDEGVA